LEYLIVGLKLCRDKGPADTACCRVPFKAKVGESNEKAIGIEQYDCEHKQSHDLLDQRIWA
jgi:hypothetical protein